MNSFDQEQKSNSNDRIICLLAELNSTLDLYYEADIQREVASTEQ